jgi:hypothetical protein
MNVLGFTVLDVTGDQCHCDLGQMICHILFVSYIIHFEVEDEIPIDKLIDTILLFLFLNSLKVFSITNLRNISKITEELVNLLDRIVI